MKLYYSAQLILLVLTGLMSGWFEVNHVHTDEADNAAAAPFVIELFDHKIAADNDLDDLGLPTHTPSLPEGYSVYTYSTEQTQTSHGAIRKPHARAPPKRFV